MTKFIKKPLSILLAALMIVSLFVAVPVTASAEVGDFVPESEYLTFTAVEAGASVTLKVASGSNLQYSLDGGELIPYTPGTRIDLVKGDSVSFRGKDTRFNASQHVSIGGKVACSGNVMSLRLDEDGRDQGLYYGCFNYMFEGCTGLISAPELPETTLANRCYESMFSGCTNLTAAPELPATTLATGCYLSMFVGCISLTTVPELPATTLATGCYERMFYACRSLTTAPELPATTLARRCYNGMFNGCSSIKLSEAQTAEYSIPYSVPSGGDGTTATDALNNMFYGTGGTFAGTPEINKTYYLYREVPKYTVTWKNGDDVLETDENVAEGTTPTYDGTNPEKASDKYYDYTFSGWSDDSNTYAADALPAVSGDVTYTAQFTATAKTFKVYVKTLTGGNYTIENLTGGTTVAQLKEIIADQIDIPVAAQRLIFAGKDLDDAKTLAEYNIVKESTIHLIIRGYTVTWKNWNGDVLETDTGVAAGSTPSYDGETPYKADGADCIYTFSGWTPEVSAVTGNVTYTAQFDATPKQPHEHDGITFEKWTSDNSLPTEAGNYVLTSDVTLSGTWNVPSGTTNLCLNGHGILLSGNDVYINVNKANLNVFDCNGSDTAHYITLEGWRGTSVSDNGTESTVDGNGNGTVKISGGYITGGNRITQFAFGGCLQVSANGNFAFNGGTIIGNKCADKGGAIYTDSSSTLTVNGGSIVYNSAYWGGAVFSNGTTTINGGSISYNVANSGGGAIELEANTLNVFGGEIKYNRVLNQNGGMWKGGGIHAYASTLNIKGNVIISDNYQGSGADANNLYLRSNKNIKVTLVGELSESAKIGVSMQSPGTFTNSSDTSYNDATKFTADGYAVYKNSDGQLYLIKLSTVTWKNDDGTIIDTTTVANGTTPTHTAPTKAEDAEYTYEFAGWTPEITAVTGDATYTATFTATPKHTHDWDLENPVWDAQPTQDLFDYYANVTFNCTGCDETKSVRANGGAVVSHDGDCVEGYYEYVICSVTVDGREFSHKYILGETEEVDPTAHPFELEEHPATDATCDAPGNTAYWYCPVCDKYFSDEDGTVEIAENSWVIPQLTAVAQIGSTKYETLEAAFAAAVDGDKITVLADCTGNGIKAPQGKFATGLTVDFGGHTYTVDANTVGSTGTETQAFQLLKGNKITFQNGKIYSEVAKMLVQNYSDLTLDKMELTPNNSGYTNYYTLSNNNGNVVINDTTINTNPAGGFAFDVCRYSSYPSVNVKVTGNSVINGNVEVSASKSDAKNGFSLTLEGGTLNGNIVVAQSAQNAIKATPEKAKVTKAAAFTQAAPEGFKWKDNGDGTSTLVAKDLQDKVDADFSVHDSADVRFVDGTGQSVDIVSKAQILGVQLRKAPADGGVYTDGDSNGIRFITAVDKQFLNEHPEIVNYGYNVTINGTTKFFSVKNTTNNVIKTNDNAAYNYYTFAITNIPENSAYENINVQFVFTTNGTNVAAKAVYKNADGVKHELVTNYAEVRNY